jgi:hypothetical protein
VPRSREESTDTSYCLITGTSKSKNMLPENDSSEPNVRTRSTYLLSHRPGELWLCCELVIPVGGRSSPRGVRLLANSSTLSRSQQGDMMPLPLCGSHRSDFAMPLQDVERSRTRLTTGVVSLARDPDVIDQWSRGRQQSITTC